MIKLNLGLRRRVSAFLSIVFVLGALSPFALAATQKTATSSGRLGVLDDIVQEAIRDEQVPGAVVLVGHDGQVIYRKAFGERSLEPHREPMTVDTIFDIASLTKVVATTTAVMQLVQQGQVRVNEPVAKYIPEFAENGKEEITVRELLTHYSGLPKDLDLLQPWEGRETALRMAYAEKPIYAPGSQFLYSDVNFIVLGALVERVSGMSLEEYGQKNIFAPLKMAHTRFLPPASWAPKVAPTQYDEHDKMLRGIVHDPTARRIGGTAGHAGLFSTADDLATFAEALLDGSSILSSLRIDPTTRTYIIILSNAVHPRGKGSAIALRSKIATAVAAALPLTVTEKDELRWKSITGYNDTETAARRLAVRNGTVQTGIDVLEAHGFDLIRGTTAKKKIGLLTNQTGMDSQGRRTIDVLAQATGVSLDAIFRPEHGVTGCMDTTEIGDSKDAATGVPVYSV